MNKNFSVVDFAQHIRMRPGMFFGSNISLTGLENMLWGFNLNAQKESKVPFQYFNFWAKKKLDRFGSTYNWAVAILEICEQDQEKAFWFFYDLLDEFLAIEPVSIHEADLNDDNFAHYYNKETKHKRHRIIGKEARYVLDPAPYHIKIFEFDYCVHAYHFDYFHVIGEYDKNIYYGHYENLSKCKETYKEKFNLKNWSSLSKDQITACFSQTINHCRNKRENII